MGLAERLTEDTSSSYLRRGCEVGALLAALPEAEARELQTFLDSTVTHSALARAIAGEWPDLVNPKETTIGRHRRGYCTCAP